MHAMFSVRPNACRKGKFPFDAREKGGEDCRLVPIFAMLVRPDGRRTNVAQEE